MAVATVDDVAVSLGRPIATSAETEQVEWWLTGVELFIAARLGSLATLDQAALRYVEAEAVAAKVRRTGTESSVSVAVDDATVTRRWENPVGADDITAEWWRLLDTDLGGGAFSARPYFEPDTIDTTLDWS